MVLLTSLRNKFDEVFHTNFNHQASNDKKVTAKQMLSSYLRATDQTLMARNYFHFIIREILLRNNLKCTL